MRIDVLAGEVQFVDHLAPVYLALPQRHRGDFVVWPSPYSDQPLADVIERARLRGVEPVTDPSDPSRPVVVTSYGDMKHTRRYGWTRIARMEHGIGQSFVTVDHPSYAGGTGAQSVSLFLTPNEHSADRWRRAYPQTSVAVVGCPKLDGLPRRVPGPGPVIAASFHWGLPVSKRHPLVETRGSWIEYHQAVGDLAKDHQVLGTGHPKGLRGMAHYYRKREIEVVADFHDVLRRADVLVCDTNSALYEFASTGRPVVVVNGSHFRRDVHHGLRFDWGPVTNVGVQCDRPQDLAGAVAQALLDTPEQRAARERALDIVYAHRTGAAKRAADAIVSWAGSLGAVAA